jgi:hypothetical protein
MAKKTIWSDVKVFMQSAIGAKKTITAVTKNATATASSVAHGFANGAYVLTEAQGMSEINQRIIRVAGQTADTFVLEGEDSSEYGVFSSGSAQLITFGTTLTTLTTVTASGGEFRSVPTTTIHEKSESTMPGLASATEYSFESIWDVSDPGLIAAKAASRIKAQRAFMIAFPDGQRVVFYGQVGTQLVPRGQQGGLVTTSIKITAQGEISTYAT